MAPTKFWRDHPPLSAARMSLPHAVFEGGSRSSSTILGSARLCDPYELRNVVRHPAMAAVRQTLAARLGALVAAA